MIYLSAQPDAFYFTWQIELQVFNFNNLGISPKDIHVLIAYDPEIGLQRHFEELIKKLEGCASFYTYPDKRIKPQYASSIRPHIITQHVERFPELQAETIFYHDSDIIFRALPDFSRMMSNEKWYVSDTKTYLDSNYIKMAGTESLLQQMCDALGINVQKVINQDTNCGGAQYLLKKVPIYFWKKLEIDAENLYIIMNKFNAENASFIEKSKPTKKIQSWCADMWAILWNALLDNRSVEIHNEMNFCWADSPISFWYKNKILHYTGNVSRENTKIFRKTNYSVFEPNYDRGLNEIDCNSCSAPLVDLIKKYNIKAEKERTNLTDCTIIILFNSDESQGLEILLTQLKYIEKFLTINICIIEKGTTKVFNNNIVGLKEYQHVFSDALNESDLSTDIYKIINISNSDNFLLTRSNIFIDISDYKEAFKRIRLQVSKIIIPGNESISKVDRLFQSIFDKCIDPLLLKLNIGKFNTAKADGVSCMFFERNVFLNTKSSGIQSTACNLSNLIENSSKDISYYDYPVFQF